MHGQRNNKNGYKFKLTETTNHSIFMNETEGQTASNPQDFVGQKKDDPTNILDFSENKAQSKRGKQGKKKKTAANENE